MRIHLSLSVFSSPTEAFCSASGDMEVASIPQKGEVFQWPLEWKALKPKYFSDDQARVWGTSRDWDTMKDSVLLYGIACDSVDEARECANFLRQVAGLYVDEYLD